VAVSTACAALDHIVVDTMNTAQQCVEYLKQHGVGVATFIGLDKMERWKTVCRKPFTTYVLFTYAAYLEDIELSLVTLTIVYGCDIL